MIFRKSQDCSDRSPISGRHELGMKAGAAQSGGRELLSFRWNRSACWLWWRLYTRKLLLKLRELCASKDGFFPVCKLYLDKAIFEKKKINHIIIGTYFFFNFRKARYTYFLKTHIYHFLKHDEAPTNIHTSPAW